jgi:hypothetical protein
MPELCASGVKAAVFNYFASDDFSLDELEQSSVVKGLLQESERSVSQGVLAIPGRRIDGDWTRLTSTLLTSGTSP